MGIPKVKLEPDWRLKEARALRSQHKCGTLREELIDPLVYRIVLHLEGASDAPLEDAITLHDTYGNVATAILEELTLGLSPEDVGREHGIDPEVIKLLKGIYDDGTTIGSPRVKSIKRVSGLAPGDRKHYLMRKKYGDLANVFMDGHKAIDGKIGNKDVVNMVKHALAQSYIMATCGDQLPLDSNEQKAVIAYNGVMINLVRLLTELEKNNSDSSAILKRMASFTNKIPKEAPSIPSIQELQQGEDGDFRLPPVEDLSEDQGPL